MFHKLHRKMTFFCTWVTALILLVFSGIFLMISESEIKAANSAAFHMNLNALISYLETQETISHSWLRQAEDSYHFLVTIRDNGKRLVFQSLESDLQKDRLTDLARATAPQAQNSGSADRTQQRPESNFQTRSSEFDLESPGGQLYRTALVGIPKNNGTLDAVVLQSYKTQETQMANQRFLFCIVDIAAIFLLGTFSWFFTRYMLRPLKENQRQQRLLTASASLGLRAPLSSILSNNAELKTAPPGDIPRLIQDTRLEAENMSRQINNMLSLTSSGGNDWRIYPEPVEFDTLILRVCEDLEPLVNKDGLHLKICFPDRALPPVNCDDQRMIQVLSILIEEILHSSDRGLCSSGQGRTIRILLDSSPRYLLLEITDQAPKAGQEDVWIDRPSFCRAAGSSYASKPELYFADKLIRLHGGRLSVKKDASGVTSFFIRLPLSEKA